MTGITGAGIGKKAVSWRPFSKIAAAASSGYYQYDRRYSSIDLVSKNSKYLASAQKRCFVLGVQELIEVVMVSRGSEDSCYILLFIVLL